MTEPIELCWATEVVPSEAIQRAAYALAASCSTETTRRGDEWVATVHPRNGADAEVLAHRFRQEVVDQALRVDIARRTEPLRNAVFAMAFSRLTASGGEGRG